IGYFSNRTIANLDSRKESITLEHIITMTSGIEWFGDSTSIMKQQSDWVQYILDRPMVHAPGEVWNYNSGPHLFSAILNMTTGVSSKTYADTYLFQPLGIDHYDWMVDPQGLVYGAGELSMRLRDIAKIGLLHLNNGTWDGEQIVPAEWVVNSSKVQSTGVSSGQMSGDYGYLWWIRPMYNARFGFGRDGQYLWVLPDYDTVVVFTSEWMTSYDYLITQYILPALGDFSQMVNTTTSETTTLTEQPFDASLAIGIGVSLAIVIVLVVFMKKR
ncbi:MAG: serine hydrolase domain-containing protein, partial [Candidatus Thorarchaeota archaeon]